MKRVGISMVAGVFMLVCGHAGHAWAAEPQPPSVDTWTAAKNVDETASESEATAVTPTGLRGAYSRDGRIHVGEFGAPDGDPITTGHQDMKPSWSKTGGMLVFFRGRASP